MHSNPQERRCLTPAEVRLFIWRFRQELRNKDRNRRMWKAAALVREET